MYHIEERRQFAGNLHAVKKAESMFHLIDLYIDLVNFYFLRNVFH